jgi:DNA-binding XRE family transcriptional regulator
LPVIILAAFIRQNDPCQNRRLLNLLSKLLEPDQALGQTLRSLRAKRKWSQEVLALRADVDRNYISLIELGRNSPSVRMLFRLCDAFDITPSDFLKDVQARMQRQQRIRAPRDTPQ